MAFIMIKPNANIFSKYVTLHVKLVRMRYICTWIPLVYDYIMLGLVWLECFFFKSQTELDKKVQFYILVYPYCTDQYRRTEPNQTWCTSLVWVIGLTSSFAHAY